MKNFGMEDKTTKIKSALDYLGVRSIIRAIIKSLVLREINNVGKGKKRDVKRK